MPYEFTALTPNLVVADVERSIAFYRDLLGFSVVTTVPDAAPYVFAIVERGTIQLNLNAPDAAFDEYPLLRGVVADAHGGIGGTFTLFLQMTGIRDLHASLEGRVPVVMPLQRKWYGVTEFAVTDPDGYVLTFAEREAEG